jgi:hypothetical protein
VQIASALASLDLPSTIVQEKGYLRPKLGDNLANLIDGILCTNKQ